MKYCKHCGQEIEDDDTFCPNCGTRVSDYSTDYTYTSNSTRNSSSHTSSSHKTYESEGNAAALGVLGFFVPVVGLILFIVWKDTNPKYSKAAGIGALISVALQFVYLIFTVFGIVLGFNSFF